MSIEYGEYAPLFTDILPGAYILEHSQRITRDAAFFINDNVQGTFNSM
jgi:hypothetical protein